jgi:hypothetical protein
MPSPIIRITFRVKPAPGLATDAGPAALSAWQTAGNSQTSNATRINVVLPAGSKRNLIFYGGDGLRE